MHALLRSRVAIRMRTTKGCTKTMTKTKTFFIRGIREIRGRKKTAALYDNDNDDENLN